MIANLILSVTKGKIADAIAFSEDWFIDRGDKCKALMDEDSDDEEEDESDGDIDEFLSLISPSNDDGLIAAQGHGLIWIETIDMDESW